MDPVTLPGKVSIMKSTGHAGTAVVIEVQDESSGVQFLRLRLSIADFAEAVMTGLSHRPCEMELRGLDVVGMVCEHKSVEIAFPYVTGESRAMQAQRAAETVAEYEVDGWRGWPDDLLNRHNLVKGAVDRYRVRFHRYVPAPPEDASA